MENGIRAEMEILRSAYHKLYLEISRPIGCYLPRT